jgi:putative ABC transport system permease protein
MTQALLRKAIANLRAKRMQSAVLFVIVALAAALLTLAAAVQRAASNPWQRTFDQTRGAHIWFASQDPAALAGISDLDGVVGSTGPYQVVAISREKRTELAGSRAPIILQERPADMAQLPGQLLLVAGRWLAPAAIDEVVLDSYLAGETGLGVGDRLTLRRGGRQLAATVVGLAYNPAPIPCPNYAHAGGVCTMASGIVVYMLPEAIRQLAPDLDTSVWVQGIRLADPQAVEYVKATFLNSLPPGSKIGSISWKALRDQQVQEIRFNQVVLAVFSVFAFGLVGFIIVNVAGGQILSEYREIGLLKSIGFRPGEITLLYVATQAALGALAAFCGIAVALLFVPNVIGRAAGVLNATGTNVLTFPLLAVVAGATVLLIALFTWLPARQAGRTNTAQAIATGYAPPMGRPSFLARLAAKVRLPPVILLGVKDAFAQPLRATLTITVIIVGVIALTFALSVEATIQKALADPSVMGYLPIDVRVGIPEVQGFFAANGENADALRARIRSLIESNPAVASFVSHGSLLAVMEGTEDVFLVHALGDDLDLVYTAAEGRKLAGNGEVMVSRRAIAEYGVNIGDRLVLVVKDKRVVLQVVGIYSEGPGEYPGLVTSIDTLVKAGATVSVNSFGLKATATGAARRLADELKQAVGPSAPVTDTRESLIQDMTEVRGLSYALNLVLLAMIAANVLATAALTVRERYRDLATMKTLGMTPGQLARSVATGSIAQCLVAITIGLPLGLVANHWLIAFVSGQVGLDQGIARLPELPWLAIIVPVTCLVVVVGSLLPARQAGRLSVVEALRME